MSAPKTVFEQTNYQRPVFFAANLARATMSAWGSRNGFALDDPGIVSWINRRFRAKMNNLVLVVVA